jgi:hypothetical protein
MLAGDLLEFLDRCVKKLLVDNGITDTDAHRDFLKRGDLHPGLVTELGKELGSYPLEVFLLQIRYELFH